MSEKVELHANVPLEMFGMRLDQAVAELFPSYSRSRLQSWIKSGDLRVNGEQRRSKDKLQGGEIIDVCVWVEATEVHAPEPIPLDIVYEDEAILVINKPSGLVVHPAAGHHSGTLLNALLHHSPEIDHVPRAGIVHRLDRETTGIMVVAKTLQAHTELVNQLQDRSMGREYEAVVQGVMTGGGCVQQPMGRHPTHRLKMAVVEDGKEAITHYRLIKKFRKHTHIRLQLETGRTHQIRVHMSHINYPLVGDPLYGGRFRLPKGASQSLLDCLQSFKRQALHARQLTLWHPLTGEQVTWETPLPDDFQQLLLALDQDYKNFQDE